jgi:hypothetical protein
VTQLNIGANSHYGGLQTTAEKRLGHGLQVQANYTLSHCIDTISNGGFLPFSAGEFCRRLRATFNGTAGLAITMSATISLRAMSTNCPPNDAVALGFC